MTDFGTEVSPSIDCHKCLRVRLGLGEGQFRFLCLQRQRVFCQWCGFLSVSDTGKWAIMFLPVYVGLLNHWINFNGTQKVTVGYTSTVHLITC